MGLVSMKFVTGGCVTTLSITDIFGKVEVVEVAVEEEAVPVVAMLSLLNALETKDWPLRSIS